MLDNRDPAIKTECKLSGPVVKAVVPSGRYIWKIYSVYHLTLSKFYVIRTNKGECAIALNNISIDFKTGKDVVIDDVT